MFDARSDADEQIAFTRHDEAVAALGQRRGARVDRRGHQSDDVLAQLLQLVAEQRANGMERLSGVLAIEEIRRLEQLRLRIGLVGMQDAILHVAVGRDNDQQHPPVRQAQEFHVPERGLAPSRRGDDASEAGELRQQLRRGIDQRLRSVGVELVLQFADLALLQRLDHEQAVDEETIAFRRRHAARRRMRAGDESHLLEIGHHVANRGRRQLEARLPRQHAGTDRLAIGDVALDQRLQQVLRAGIKHAGHFML